MTPAEYAAILHTCCNRYGWERAVVDAAPCPDYLRRWELDRRRALEGGGDWRTTVTVWPGEG